MASIPKCLIFGHSFIKRLAEKQVADPWIFKTNLGLEQCSVTLKGFGGLNFGLKNLRAKQKFYAIVDDVFKCNTYDFVICQLGGNDVSSYISPSALRDAFADFISYICETYNVKFVYICSIFTRPEPRYIGPAEYETFRVQINKLLEEYAQGHDSVTFWPHKRIFNSPLSLFEHDGTHLNIVGSKKFFKSLRQAAIFAVEQYHQIV